MCKFFPLSSSHTWNIHYVGISRFTWPLFPMVHCLILTIATVSLSWESLWAFPYYLGPQSCKVKHSPVDSAQCHTSTCINILWHVNFRSHISRSALLCETREDGFLNYASCFFYANCETFHVCTQKWNWLIFLFFSAILIRIRHSSRLRTFYGWIIMQELVCHLKCVTWVSKVAEWMNCVNNGT